MTSWVLKKNSVCMNANTAKELGSHTVVYIIIIKRDMAWQSIILPVH